LDLKHVLVLGPRLVLPSFTPKGSAMLVQAFLTKKKKKESP
jgi:hypothetical protein